jgi:ABC-type bacteriocin/lantibiotic exporter with double-glycine peptidase domain
MATLHIVQGDIGLDKLELEKAARDHVRIRTWIVPKSARIGDGFVRDNLLCMSLGHTFVHEVR